jgi:DMSO reductase anchor subunit
MATKYILAVLSIAFFAAGGRRLIQDAGRLHPQSRTWLLIAVIFGVVSSWLFVRG